MKKKMPGSKPKSSTNGKQNKSKKQKVKSEDSDDEVDSLKQKSATSSLIK